MSISLYNTMTRKKERFQPIEAAKVRMYVCGPTVYDACHIGHARSVVVFDVIARYFAKQGFTVHYIRNFTDVDDKIIKRAQELGQDPLKMASRYIDDFHRDMDALNVQRATHEPRVTQHIPDIVAMIERLLEKGFAYQVEGDVFFEVGAYKDYGKLSRRRLEDMTAGARVNIDPRKRHPFDFALWKSSKAGEPAWQSPWGAGRPGWHIECSAMSSRFLGETFDIHGGGKDLIFPHHENEIAQSECATGAAFANYWVHNGFIKIRQEKMSKSLGNFLLIRDVLRSYHPEALRLFLLSKQYRKPIDYSEKAMSDATSALDRLYGLFERMDREQSLEKCDKADPASVDACWERFCSVMNDDFNTAAGIGILFDAVKLINRLLDRGTDRLSAGDLQRILSIRKAVRDISDVLGILAEPAADYHRKKKRAAAETLDVDPQIIDAMIQERSAARRAKDWQKADAIRQKLAQMNVLIEDRPEGTVWKIET